MAVEQALAQFKETEGGEAFRLQNSKLLKVELAGVEIQAKLGSMVAYQGDVSFEHAGSGGLSRMIKKAVTNEGADLMKVSGTGEIFLADMAQDDPAAAPRGRGDHRQRPTRPRLRRRESTGTSSASRVHPGRCRAASTTWSSREPATSPWSPTDRRC